MVMPRNLKDSTAASVLSRKLQFTSKMSHANDSVHSEAQDDRFLEILMVSSLSTIPSCVFLYINGIMLFTLRSKTVFCETARYILLYNLLFAETVQLVLSQVLFLLAADRVIMTYPVCGFLTQLTILTTVISPLTLVVMSVERYVAVCYPLRHADIVTVRNTDVSVILIWMFSFLNVLIRLLLLLELPFDDLLNLQVKGFCSSKNMFVGPISEAYSKAFTGFVFTSAGVAIISSYIGVAAAARSASADKASAHKARNTLLLHLVQLGLSLSSTIYTPLLIALSTVVVRIVLVRIQTLVYMFTFIVPRCLSSLIYGLRDQSIRPVLMFYLCCRQVSK
ncbi:odorant receptor 131-2-like [Acanthochromis polyacanthus]|uniref:odorant receptor 131-2-like n=1 Tax=Acanthochromis polyacanthus TaxID=80966 RepID=UPI002233F57B|nr:odorant receptor 131-2-like [Acanthochromis polyacanthus]